jgi:hypothetical protein
VIYSLQHFRSGCTRQCPHILVAFNEWAFVSGVYSRAGKALHMGIPTGVRCIANAWKTGNVSITILVFICNFCKFLKLVSGTAAP